MGSPHVDPNFICANMNRKTTSSYIRFFGRSPKKGTLNFCKPSYGPGSKFVKGLFNGTPIQETA